MIPGTSLLTTRFGFGCASLHHLLLSQQRQALLDAAYSAGVRHFDCARMYGHGLAEAELGSFLHGRRKDAVLATKFGIPANAMYESLPWLQYPGKALNRLKSRLPMASVANLRKGPVHDFSLASAEKSLFKSLKALRTDYLDILFMHDCRLADLIHGDEIASWLLHLKHRGIVRFTGLAGSAGDGLDVAKRYPAVVDIIQARDSLEQREADLLHTAGRALQITFGYLRSWNESHRGRADDSMESDASEVLLRAAARNAKGVVLFSTRSIDHMQTLLSAMTIQHCASRS